MSFYYWKSEIPKSECEKIIKEFDTSNSVDATTGHYQGADALYPEEIEELKKNTHVPVEWTIVDFMDKKLIADVLQHQDVLVSTSLDHSFKNESKNLKGIFMPGAGWEKVSPEAVPDGCLVTNSYEHEIGIAEM